MHPTIQKNAPVADRIGPASLVRGIVFGSIGGLVGTIAMNLVMIAVLPTVGLSVAVPFATIGDTAAGFFRLIGIELAGGSPLGVAVYYLLGPLLGLIFGAAVTRVGAFRVSTFKKGILLAVLYAEVASQPILAMAPLILPMTTSATLQWFGLSAVLHLIWGIVLGVIVSYGLRSAPLKRLVLTHTH